MAAVPSRSRSWETSSTVFFEAAIRASSSSFAGTSRKLSGSSRSRTCASPEKSTSSTSRLRSPPESWRGAPRADVVEPRADDRAAGRVPLALELVAAELRPVRDRLAEPHAGVGRVPARLEVALGGEHLLPRRAQPRGRELEEHLADRARVRADADVLRHVGEGADVGVALDRLEPAGEDPQQRRLADAVGADEADVLAAADLEGDVGEEQVAAGMRVGEVGDDDVRHDAA